jgi:hypothetical protein
VAPDIDFVQVSSGEGSADQYILAHVEPADIAITRDIPLAAELVERGVIVLNDRGNVYTGENVRERLSIRDFMAELRGGGVYESSGRTYSSREVRAFANAFDRELTRRLRLK